MKIFSYTDGMVKELVDVYMHGPQWIRTSDCRKVEIRGDRWFYVGIEMSPDPDEPGVWDVENRMVRAGWVSSPFRPSTAKALNEDPVICKAVDAYLEASLDVYDLNKAIDKMAAHMGCPLAIGRVIEGVREVSK